ncbi:MAG: TetR/AcrR family transcriptional regulator [bacterium]|nr:TetR/AcrR family transcriptional regulator [bacterium]
MSAKGDTRRRILSEARRLFNEQGTRSVTTNHIAAAAAVSPGNLYYHFRNKEAILREIHQAMIERAAAFWRGAAERPATSEALERTLYLLQFFVWEYRFFRLEQNALLRADPELHRRHIAYHAERSRSLEAFFAALEAQGVFKTLDGQVREALMRSFWMIADYWISALHSEGRALNRKNVREGSLLLRTLFDPHLSGSRKTRSGE